MQYQILLRLLLLFYVITISAVSANTLESYSDSSDYRAQAFDYDEALRSSQAALDNQLGNQTFVNSDGSLIELKQFLGKPLVLSMVYTSCYQICPMTTRHLSKVVEKARDALGTESFSVAVVGFDTTYDNPQTMQYFAKNQGIDDKKWNLLSMSTADVEKFTREIGFVYTPSSNGFDHIIQATIIDQGGKVYRQIYGQAFDTPLLVDPLIELVLGRARPQTDFVSDLTRKIKLFCTTYDPVRDGYYLDYSLFLGIFIGGTIILIISFVLFRESLNRRKLSGD